MTRELFRHGRAVWNVAAIAAPTEMEWPSHRVEPLTRSHAALRANENEPWLPPTYAAETEIGRLQKAERCVKKVGRAIGAPPSTLAAAFFLLDSQAFAARKCPLHQGDATLPWALRLVPRQSRHCTVNPAFRHFWAAKHDETP